MTAEMLDFMKSVSKKVPLAVVGRKFLIWD